jgi:hypothetical protein
MIKHHTKSRLSKIKNKNKNTYSKTNKVNKKKTNKVNRKNTEKKTIKKKTQIKKKHRKEVKGGSMMFNPFLKAKLEKEKKEALVKEAAKNAEDEKSFSQYKKDIEESRKIEKEREKERYGKLSDAGKVEWNRKKEKEEKDEEFYSSSNRPSGVEEPQKHREKH